MAQTKRMSVIEARIQTLRKKEAKVVHEKHEFDRKQLIAFNLLSSNSEFARSLTVERLKVIPMQDLLKMKAMHEWKITYYRSAKRLQRWWRRIIYPNTVSAIRVVKKACVTIQKCWRLFIARRKMKAFLKHREVCAAKIQRLARRTLLRTNSVKLIKIHQNLSDFGKLKLKIHTDSQIRIAYHWRKFWKIKQAKIAAEAERKKNKKKKQLSKTSKLTKKKKKAAPKKTEAVDSNSASGKTSVMEVRNESKFSSTLNERA